MSNHHCITLMPGEKKLVFQTISTFCQKKNNQHMVLCSVKKSTWCFLVTTGRTIIEYSQKYLQLRFSIILYNLLLLPNSQVTMQYMTVKT
jgi:hypothetical protein